jgi:hypothetical protein
MAAEQVTLHGAPAYVWDGDEVKPLLDLRAPINTYAFTRRETYVRLDGYWVEAVQTPSMIRRAHRWIAQRLDREADWLGSLGIKLDAEADL